MKSLLEQAIDNNDPILAMEALKYGEKPTLEIVDWACTHGNASIFEVLHKSSNLLDDFQVLLKVLITALDNNQFTIAEYIFKQYPEKNFYAQIRKIQEEAVRNGNGALLKFLFTQKVKQNSLGTLVDIAIEARQTKLAIELLTLMPQEKRSGFCDLTFFRGICRQNYPLLAMLLLARDILPVKLAQDKKLLKITAVAVTQKQESTAMSLCMLSIWHRQQDSINAYSKLDKYIKKLAPAPRKLLKNQMNLYSQLFFLLNVQSLLPKDITMLLKNMIVCNFLEFNESSSEKKSKSRFCIVM